MAFVERFKRGWNAFRSAEEEDKTSYSSPSRTLDLGVSSSFTPHRTRVTRYGERSILDSIITRVAMDVASLEFRHI